jgi:serine-type anaerobic sulfatase-maturating enzyme
MLHLHGVAFNTLSVINRANAKKLDVYRFLKHEVRSRQMQFIPCVAPKVFRNVAPQMWDADSLPLFDSSAAHPGNPDSVVTDW